MGFAEALEATRGRTQDRVSEVLDALDPDDREACLTALRDPTVTHAHLARALKAIGHEVGVSSVKRWRERNVVR